MEIHSNVQTALDQLNEIRGIGSGRLSIGLIPYGITATMGKLMGNFNQRYPKLELHVGLGSMGYLRERMMNKEFDFLIGEIDEANPDKQFRTRDSAASGALPRRESVPSL